MLAIGMTKVGMTKLGKHKAAQAAGSAWDDQQWQHLCATVQPINNRSMALHPDRQ